MKPEDPIVAEVRKARETHARRFGYDMARICRDLKRMDQAGQIGDTLKRQSRCRARQPRIQKDHFEYPFADVPT